MSLWITKCLVICVCELIAFLSLCLLRKLLSCLCLELLGLMLVQLCCDIVFINIECIVLNAQLSISMLIEFVIHIIN